MNQYSPNTTGRKKAKSIELNNIKTTRHPYSMPYESKIK
jgi:hypothetical protein